MKKPVLILGAASGMARAIARSFAAEGHAIQLAARNVERLEADRDDLVTRYGVEVTLHEFDALDLDGHADFVAALPALPRSPSAPWARWARRRRTRKTP
jgi:decaprenylphospho-beta-D-erythro-pentofuranosid-2-ulose 2-reductase